MRVFHLKINGDSVDVAAPEHYSLLEILRYELGLTGSKQGCDKGDCGACTVQIDGKPLLACLVLPATVEGKSITTIEGLAAEHRANGGEGASLLQNAFDDAGALQCGFCQPGMIMSAQSLLEKNSSPNRDDIKQALSGNLCRCTGYTQIYTAVESAATSGNNNGSS
ncbi:MAG: (2Fe-2S)-binding protein [Planctomycetes bacterium]|nr:(2Fe-2S)-binding protein [Planctomycetota bacterium]